MGFAALESTGYAFTVFVASRDYVGVSIVSTIPSRLRSSISSSPFVHATGTAAPNILRTYAVGGVEGEALHNPFVLAVFWRQRRQNTAKTEGLRGPAAPEPPHAGNCVTPNTTTESTDLQRERGEVVLKIFQTYAENPMQEGSFPPFFRHRRIKKMSPPASRRPHPQLRSDSPCTPAASPGHF